MAYKMELFYKLIGNNDPIDELLKDWYEDDSKGSDFFIDSSPVLEYDERGIVNKRVFQDYRYITFRSIICDFKSDNPTEPHNIDGKVAHTSRGSIKSYKDSMYSLIESYTDSIQIIGFDISIINKDEGFYKSAQMGDDVNVKYELDYVPSYCPDLDKHDLYELKPLVKKYLIENTSLEADYLSSQKENVTKLQAIIDELKRERDEISNNKWAFKNEHGKIDLVELIVRQVYPSWLDISTLLSEREPARYDPLNLKF